MTLQDLWEAFSDDTPLTHQQRRGLKLGFYAGAGAILSQIKQGLSLAHLRAWTAELTTTATEEMEWAAGRIAARQSLSEKKEGGVE